MEDAIRGVVYTVRLYTFQYRNPWRYARISRWRWFGLSLSSLRGFRWRTYQEMGPRSLGCVGSFGRRTFLTARNFVCKRDCRSQSFYEYFTIRREHPLRCLAGGS